MRARARDSESERAASFPASSLLAARGWVPERSELHSSVLVVSVVGFISRVHVSGSISGTVQIVTTPACVMQERITCGTGNRVPRPATVSTRLSLNRSLSVSLRQIRPTRTQNVCTDSDGSSRIGDVKIPLPPISMYISVWAMTLARTPQRQRMAPTHNTRVCGSTRDFGGGGVNSVSSTHLSCNGMNLSRS